MFSYKPGILPPGPPLQIKIGCLREESSNNNGKMGKSLVSLLLCLQIPWSLNWLTWWHSALIKALFTVTPHLLNHKRKELSSNFAVCLFGWVMGCRWSPLPYWFPKSDYSIHRKTKVGPTVQSGVSGWSSTRILVVFFTQGGGCDGLLVSINLWCGECWGPVQEEGGITLGQADCQALVQNRWSKLSL